MKKVYFLSGLECQHFDIFCHGESGESGLLHVYFLIRKLFIRKWGFRGQKNKKVKGYTSNHEESFLVKSKKNATFLTYGVKIGKNGQS